MRIFDPEGYARFRAWGPFIDPDTYVPQPTTVGDIWTGGVVFTLAMIFAITGTYLAVQQTRAARRPWRSAYVWMIWIEIAANVVITIECLLYLLYIIRPSFYFYMSILFLWAIEIHLLLQIIINRIRVILQDRHKGRILIIGTAVFVFLINISVFCIWIPARLEISQRYIHINAIWDRIEKSLYLCLDGCLNWYFIRVVKANLVANGLEKYNRLVRFNQRIIIVSLLMDVMIIGAMSIPNGFAYAIFHPLGFLVKVNIEMTMANLIRKIALSKEPYHPSFLGNPAFNSLSTNSSGTPSDPMQPHALARITPTHREWYREWFSSLFNANAPWSAPHPPQLEDGILKTETFSVVSRQRSHRWGSSFMGKSKASVKKREDSLGLEQVDLSEGSMSESKSIEENNMSGSLGEGSKRSEEHGAEEGVLVPELAAVRRES